MTEYFSEVKDSRGESQTVQRDIVPISLKLSTLSLVERFFRFQSSSFLEKNKQEINVLSEHQQFMKKNNINYHDDFLQSKEFDFYVKFVRENFWWQAGVYRVRFFVRSPETVNTTHLYYEFSLSQDNIDTLKNNINEIKPALEFVLKKPDLPDFSGQPGNWVWVHPSLIKAKTK